MSRSWNAKHGYRTMTQEEIWALDKEGCIRGIASCKSAMSIAKRYNDKETFDKMELQIGLFTIQQDMLASGDIVVKD